MRPLVQTVLAARPDPPATREKLDKAFALIDAANAQDPDLLEWEGEKVPYRLLFSRWLTEWVLKLDPKAPDELLLLARGNCVELWKLKDIKRDDFAPNAAGTRQWEMERRTALAQRLLGICREAGYEADSLKLVEDVMLGKDVPDPFDVRPHDIKGALGTVNTRLLEEAYMLQVLRDADTMVFMTKAFPQLLVRYGAEELMDSVERHLSGISMQCAAMLIEMPWSPVQKKLITKALPAPRRLNSVIKAAEGTAAASSHPGDWRYRNFDYE